MSQLPEYVSPMLATLGRDAFDSDDHLFEVKWDGTRAISFLEGDGYRIFNRNKRDMFPRYPELEVLNSLERGTVLDGEIVVLRDGKPDFSAVMSRDHASDPRRIQAMIATHPITYVVFDILYKDYESTMGLPLSERKELLSEVLDTVESPHLAKSEGLRTSGSAFFDEIERMELEGMVAKDLGSTYQPGKRTDSWIKIKTTREVQCLILGFVPDGTRDVKSLIIAVEEEGDLRCVGKVGSGLGQFMRRRLRTMLDECSREAPLIETKEVGVWVEPEFFCTVRYLEMTREGGLRAPVFVGMVEA